MVNIPLGKNAPFRKIYFGAIIPSNNAFTQSDKKVYFRVGLFSCQCCKLLFANKKSSAPSTNPLTSDGIERFKRNPAQPLAATRIAHGYVTQKSYILTVLSLSSFLLSSLFAENTAPFARALSIEVTFVVLWLLVLLGNITATRGCSWRGCPSPVGSLSTNFQHETVFENDERQTRPFLFSSLLGKWRAVVAVLLVLKLRTAPHPASTVGPFISMQRKENNYS